MKHGATTNGMKERILKYLLAVERAKETHAWDHLAKTKTIEDPTAPSYVEMKTNYIQEHIHHLAAQQLDMDTTISEYMS